MSAGLARRNNSLRKNSRSAPASIRLTSAELNAVCAIRGSRTLPAWPERLVSAPQSSVKGWTPEAVASVWNGQETHGFELAALAKRADENKKLGPPVEIEKSVDEILFPPRL